MYNFNSVFQIYYYVDENIFTDEDGFIIYNIWNYITANDLFLFRAHKEYMLVPHAHIKGVGCELMYPEED